MSDAPRVLMTADAVGGVWRHALDLARELCAQGGEVLLVTMGPPPDGSQRAEAEAIEGLALLVSDHALEWSHEPWDEVDRASEWLLDADHTWWPDVVHLNGYCHGALPWSAPVVMAGHSCVTSWWQAVRGRPAPATWDEYRRRVRAGLAAADLVVAPTQAMLAALRHHHGPLPRARVIPNGTDTSRHRGGAKEPFVLSVGRAWDEAKNVEALAAVAGDLPWPVRLAGETSHPGGGPAPALADVEPLGPLPHDAVLATMARAAIFAHPARYEPFGLAVLEAALSGCALVLADIPSLRELWGDAALFAPPDDHEALSAALTQAMTDAEVRDALVARAQGRGRAFGARRMARAYRGAYDELRAREVHP